MAKRMIGAALLFAAALGAALADEPVGGLKRRADWGMGVAPPANAGDGARIAVIRPGGAAERAGLAAGDRIVALDGRPVGSADDFLRRWRRLRAGDRLALAVVRDGRALAEQRLVAAALPLERIDGVEVRYDSVDVGNGDRVRTLWTRPAGSGERALPVLAFVPWLSCSPVETGVADGDGWKTMLRDVARDSGWATLRIEKPGVGDSVGSDCADNDLQRDLAAYRAALKALRERPPAGIDPKRTVLFGGSFGASFVPLLADEAKPIGLVASGGFNRTLLEHLLGFERRRLTLSGAPAERINAAMRAFGAIYDDYLNGGRTPGEVIAARPELRGVWSEGPAHQYGRPAAYFQQIQALDVEGAWARVAVPTLVVYGEHDWFMARDDQQRIVEAVNARSPGAAELFVVPGMNHHFERFDSAQAAFDERDGRYAPEAAARIAGWLRRLAP